MAKCKGFRNYKQRGEWVVSDSELAKALSFPGIYEVVRGDRAISADTAIRLGKHFGLPARSG